MNFLIPLSFVQNEICTDQEIINWPGGLKRGDECYVGIVKAENITKLYLGKIKGNRHTQRPPSYPAGYHPFQIGGQKRIYDIGRHTFEVQQIEVMPGVTPAHVRRILVPKKAVWVKPPRYDSKLSLLLQEGRRRTELHDKVRDAVRRGGLGLLNDATDFLEEDLLRGTSKGSDSLAKTTAERFEFHLQWSAPETLERLLASIDSVKSITTPLDTAA